MVSRPLPTEDEPHTEGDDQQGGLGVKGGRPGLDAPAGGGAAGRLRPLDTSIRRRKDVSGAIHRSIRRAWTNSARLGGATTPASGPGPAGRAPPTLSAGPARRRVDAVVGLPHPKSTLLIVALRVWLVLRP